ncbi:hypothetical protein CcaCcLH18_13389 [Colletotrichum camelliae]|nr:hypothetical protein CcaCcLH18_13389 [Colletotrichum camelliae]
MEHARCSFPAMNKDLIQIDEPVHRNGTRDTYPVTSYGSPNLHRTPLRPKFPDLPGKTASPATACNGGNLRQSKRRTVSEAFRNLPYLAKGLERLPTGLDAFATNHEARCVGHVKATNSQLNRHNYKDVWSGFPKDDARNPFNQEVGMSPISTQTTDRVMAGYLNCNNNTAVDRSTAVTSTTRHPADRLLEQNKLVQG